MSHPVYVKDDEGKLKVGESGLLVTNREVTTSEELAAVREQQFLNDAKNSPEFIGTIPTDLAEFLGCAHGNEAATTPLTLSMAAHIYLNCRNVSAKSDLLNFMYDDLCAASNPVTYSDYIDGDV